MAARRARPQRSARAAVAAGRVVEDRDDRERYEVTIRKGAFRYKIELSRSFRVLEVNPDRVGGDSGSNNDSDSDSDSDGDAENDD